MKKVNISLIGIISIILYSCDLLVEDNSLRIISPNGGEFWEEGSIQKIKFTGGEESNNGSWYSFSLYYSADYTENWIRIGDGWSDVGEGEYEWEVPVFYNTLTNCRVKISQAKGIEDVSNDNFTIRAKEQSNLFTILKPNGGEIFNEQTNQEVIWYTTGDIGGNNLRLKYTLNGGIEWHTINNNHPNDGSYTWVLPNITDITDYCLFGIWNITNSDSSQNLYKISDNFFSIIPDSNYYRIIQPNGGEILQSGQEYQILWTSGGDVNDLEIYYSLFGGDSWYLIDDYEVDDGSFLWSVPSVQGTNDACKIKIQSIDQDDWFDISDSTFTISNQ